MKSLRLVAAFAAAGLIGVLSVAATAVPAGAATFHASSVNAVQQSQAEAPSPAIAALRCGFLGDHFVTWYGNCAGATTHGCTVGNHGNFSPPQFVSNGCAGDVLMYRDRNNTGTTLCINGDSRTGHLASAWRSFRVPVGGC